MIGPFHYREAERLLDVANQIVPSDPGNAAHCVALAHVHALLANAAANAMEHGFYEDEWLTVLSGGEQVKP